jgi:uncharacterized protein YdeI (YjbR/CyaY-like superfamily)
MPRDPRVDAYISKAPDFAKPILKHIRELVHEGCPEAEETIKWSVPFFEYKGTLCSMAAFKQRCAFGFWKGSLILDKKGEPLGGPSGQFRRLTKLTDLPADRVLIGYIKKATELNAEGAKVPATPKVKVAKALAVPPELVAALKKNRKAASAFEAFSQSHRNEYIEWITDAKSEDTRKRRLETALEWIAEGKARHWKYERKS